MKKVFILILGLSLTAASCDLASGSFDLGNSTRGVFASTDRGESFHAADKLSPKGDLSGIAVNALAFDSTNADTIYLASSSGIYKSTDAAGSWHFILSGLTAADVALDPTNSQIIYASGVSGSNGKIIKSLDGGTTWVDIYTEPSKNNPVYSVAVDPVDPTVVVAGLYSGQIIRSFDAGHTWQAVKDLKDRILRIRFGNGHTVYALSFHQGLEKSSDGGLNWTETSQTLTEQQFASTGQGVTTATLFYDLALDNRQAGVIYLGTQEGLFRTVNDGTNWSFMKLPLKGSSLRASSVGVDPSNSNIIYVAVASTIFKSINGGLTWETKVLPTTSEVHTISINPMSSNVVYIGVGNTR